MLAAGSSAAPQSKTDNKYEASLRLRRLKGPKLVRWLFKVGLELGLGLGTRLGEFP